MQTHARTRTHTHAHAHAHTCTHPRVHARTHPWTCTNLNAEFVFFFKENWPSGATISGALPLAVEQINADPTLMPGYVLEYRAEKSGCSGSAALQGLGKLLSESISAVIGPGCSEGCERVIYFPFLG